MTDVKPCAEHRVHGRHAWEEDEPPMWHLCRGVEVVVFDAYGALNSIIADVTGMAFPHRCARCNHVHDTGLLTEWQRYLDCTAWRCPNCKSLIDDRPLFWGGSAIPLDNEGRERR